MDVKWEWWLDPAGKACIGKASCHPNNAFGARYHAVYVYLDHTWAVFKERYPDMFEALHQEDRGRP